MKITRVAWALDLGSPLYPEVQLRRIHLPDIWVNDPAREDATERMGGRWVQRLAKHEAEDDEDDEYALSRVHDDAHPHALPPPRGIGGKDDVSQGGGDRPRLVQMVEGKQNSVCYKVAPSEDTLHARQQKPPKEQVLPQERDEDQLHDEHPEPDPVSAEELLATGF